jgi:hypothetical protein
MGERAEDQTKWQTAKPRAIIYIGAAQTVRMLT